VSLCVFRAPLRLLEQKGETGTNGDLKKEILEQMVLTGKGGTNGVNGNEVVLGAKEKLEQMVLTE
jgi:hypothetical protein